MIVGFVVPKTAWQFPGVRRGPGAPADARAQAVAKAAICQREARGSVAGAETGEGTGAALPFEAG